MCCQLKLHCKLVLAQVAVVWLTVVQLLQVQSETAVPVKGLAAMTASVRTNVVVLSDLKL